MKQERYEELNRSLPSSLRVKLERISRYLSQNMASVMVGAGFSLNAKKLNPAARMLKWSDLVKTFWEMLYPDQPLNVELTTPMHLASLLEAQYGRSELDSQIENSLPDNDFEPGDLHLALMRLPWKDVFTTNYDRLLERAGQKTGRKYNLVTNRKTLIYTSSPRIVKLHGSFPDIRPFLMTEDDFRTYPEKYPEFVNTVRQALIENVFCLVGFSGEDPNFLSWLGWLRDVMGDYMSPTYLIDYKENIQDADIKLNHQRKVDVVNLAEIPHIKGFTEALTFFFMYLQENMDEKKEWNAYLGLRPYETKNLKDLTQLMREIREEYPGWIFLPDRYVRQFDDLTDYFPYLGEKSDLLRDGELIDFLYEIDWRLRITGSPCAIGWYIEKLQSFKLNEVDKKYTKKVLQLKLTLLTVFRTMLEREQFDKIEAELMSYYETHEDETLGKFYYECCLMGLIRCQHDKVRSILAEWLVSDTDYQGLLWKASILNNLGETEKCVALLDTVRNKVGAALLNTTCNREYLNSCAHMANLILRYYTPMIDVKSIDLHRQDGIDFDNLLYHLRLESDRQKAKTGRYDEHGYLLNEVNTVWRSEDRGFFKDYANAYRLLSLIDQVGHPLQVFGRPLRNSMMEQALTTMTRYDSGMVLSFLIRMNGDNWMQRSIFTRELMGYVKVDEAELFYQDWFETCKKVVAGKTRDKAIMKLAIETIVPILMMMSVKLKQDELKELLKLYLKIYERKEPSYQEKYLKLIYACMDKKSLQQMMPVVYKTLMTDYERIMDSHIELPERGYEGYKPDSSVIKVMIDGFNSDNMALNQEAFVRLKTLTKHCGSGWMTRDLKKAVAEWRTRGTMRVQERESYQYLPAQGRSDTKAFEKTVNDDVEKLLHVVFDKKQFTSVLMAFRDQLQMLTYEPQMLTAQINIIAEKVAQFMKIYEKAILGVEQGVDFSGEYPYVDYFFEVLKQFLLATKLQGMKRENIQLMLSMLSKFTKKFEIEHAIALLQVGLHPAAEETTNLAKERENGLFSGLRKRRNDNMRAILLYAENGADITELVQRVMQHIVTAQNESVNEYVDFLVRLEHKGLIAVDEELIKTMSTMLQRVGESGFSANTQMDVAYSSITLALRMAKKERKAMKVLNGWKKYAEGPEVFNDVKVALEN